MQILQWALRRLGGGEAPAEQSPSASAWPGSPELPSGLAQSDEALREAVLSLARRPGVERVALLRANGGLFCGRSDEGKERFSQSVQKLALAGRRAARRMGLGAIESLVLEDSSGAVVVGAGHSVCGAQCAATADAEALLREIAPLVGLAKDDDSSRRDA